MDRCRCGDEVTLAYSGWGLCWDCAEREREQAVVHAEADAIAVLYGERPAALYLDDGRRVEVA